MNRQKQRKWKHLCRTMETNCCSKLFIHIVDRHTGSKWLMHGNKHHKDIHFQYPSWWYKFDIRASDSDMLDPIFYKGIHRQKRPETWANVGLQYIDSESWNLWCGSKEMTRNMKIPVKVVIIMTELVTNSNIDENKNDIPRQNNGHPK